MSPWQHEQIPSSDHALFKWNVDILVGLTTGSLQDIIKIPAGTTETSGKTCCLDLCLEC